MANKRIVDLDTQGEIDIDNLKFVLDSVGDGTKSITFKRVLDFATKQAETKQAEQDIGMIFEWQVYPDFIVLPNGAFRIGRRIFAIPFGQTISDGVNLYPKYAEILNKQNPELKGIIVGNDYKMPRWVGRYLRSGNGLPQDGDYGLGNQSLPALQRGDLQVVNYSGSKTTSEYKGGFNIQEEANGTPIVEARGSATLLKNQSNFQQFDTGGSGARRNTSAIDLNHTHPVSIDHGHAMDGNPKYDRTIDVGDVNPNHVNVLRAICIGTYYD